MVKANRTLAEAVRLHKQGQLREASALAQKLLGTDRNHADAHNLLGVIALQTGEYDNAESYFTAALKIQPKTAALHHNLANVLRIRGDFSAAEAGYRRALALKSDYAQAYSNLCDSRRFTRDDGDLEQVETLLERDDWSLEDRCFLHFAGGKFCDDIGEHDRAFEHYRQGSACRKARFDMDGHWRKTEQILHAFDADLFKRHARAAEAEGPQPIFIVGMPRSGTTLLEQILASHPQVAGAGELTDIGAIAGTLKEHHPKGIDYPANIAELPSKVFQGFGRAYLNRIAGMANGASHVVDKMPQNYGHVGLIRLLLPQARILHIRRDPRASCLSCYFQLFREGHEYSYSLSDLGLYWNRYAQMMQHWKHRCGDALLELDYESLVKDPETVLRRVLKHCGLDWHDDCLAFHRRKGTVSTASSWQVRQPLYKTSAERWQKYEAHLGPLLAQLDATTLKTYRDGGSGWRRLLGK